MPHQKILIIDDEAASIGLLLAYLGDRAGQIMVALDGPDGIAKALRGETTLSEVAENCPRSKTIRPPSRLLESYE